MRIAATLLFACAATLALLSLALAAYLQSPAGAEQASRFLSDRFPSPVTVTSLKVRPWKLTAEGVSVASPPAWGKGNLLTIRRLEIAPDVVALVTGKRRIRSLDFQGAALLLARNGGGAWNMTELLRQLPRRQSSPAETYIGRLSLHDCSVSVEDRRFDHLDATLTNLSTTGSATSRIEVTAATTGSETLRIAGEMTPGRQPAFQLTVAAPRLPIGIVTSLSPATASLFKGDGSFGLNLDARLADGILSVAGSIPFRTGLSTPHGGALPLNGSLTFSAHYDQEEDKARLQNCSLALHELLSLEAHGEMTEVKGSGRFHATASMTEVPLDRLWPLAAESIRRRFSVGGGLALTGIRLEGDRRSGIRKGGALLRLRDALVKDGKGPLLTGLSARIAAERKPGAWHLAGLVSQEDQAPGQTIANLRATLAAQLRDGRKPILLLSPVTATCLGAPFTGRLQYLPDDSPPLSGALHLVDAPLATLNRFLPAAGPRFSAGTASLDLEASGQDRRHLTARLDLRLDKLRGSMAGKEFKARGLSTQARLLLAEGPPALTGSARLQEGTLGGESAAISFAYAFADQLLSLSKLEGSVAGTIIRMEELSGPLPRLSTRDGEKRLPLQLTFRGLALSRGGLEATEMAGNLDCLYITADGKRWLQGTGLLKAPSLSLGGHDVGTATTQLRLASGKGTLQLTGLAFGGQVTATATGDPFGPDHRASFSLDSAGLQGASIMAALRRPLPVRLGRGTISAVASGTFSPSDGLHCRFGTTATDLALSRGRKTLITNGSVVAHGTVEGPRVSLEEAKVSLGEGVTARLTGEVTRPGSPARKGSIRFLLPPTAATLLLDSLANTLPPLLQEARTEGTLALSGELLLEGDSLIMDGETVLTGLEIDLPTQKTSVTGVNGRIPFSLAHPSSPAVRADSVPLARQAYPALLEAFSAPGKGTPLKIGRIKLGDLELVDTEVTLTAQEGISSITSLRSHFFGGDLFARGHFRYGTPLEYGADLLVHDLSLQRLCASVPAIRGYLSGRVDGVVGLFSEKTPPAGLAGTVEVWTRPGNGELMLISREFLQKLAGKNLKGLFFRTDRPYDRGEVSAFLEGGYLTFDRLDISHTNLLGVRDLSVTVVPVQNRIALSHLIQSIRDAAARGKGKGSDEGSKTLSPEPELLWLQ